MDVVLGGVCSQTVIFSGGGLVLVGETPQLVFLLGLQVED